MRINTAIYSSILACSFLMGCKKNEFRTDESGTPGGKSFLKIAYFSPYFVPKNVQIYVNEERVSNTITANHTPFPGGGYNTGGDSFNGYLAVDASKGNASFRFVIPNPGTSIISSQLFNVTAPIAANKQQLIVIGDTAANTTAYTVDVDADRPDSGYVKFNFTNNIPNAQPIDFYYADSAIARNVAYKGVVNFVTVPLKASPVLKMYLSGADTSATTRVGQFYTFGSIGNQKIYTMVARGYMGASDNQRIPKVSLVIVK